MMRESGAMQPLYNGYLYTLHGEHHESAESRETRAQNRKK